MRLIVLFSGQGNQTTEHVQRLGELATPVLLEALAAALPEPLTYADLAHLPAAALSANRLAQPLLCAYQLAMWQQLAPLLPVPSLVAGYSLGEMAAAAVSGLFSPPEAIALCARRARLMDSCLSEPAGLLAVIGLPDQVLARLCESSGVTVAIRNGQGHVVLGGRQRALAQFAERALAAGATRVVPLAVSVPSHTAALRPAAAAMAGELAVLPAVKRQGRLAVPLASGINGRLLRRCGEAAEALAAQIATPLDWAACMEAVIEARPDAVLEIGPGNALARMLAEAAPGLPVRSGDDFRSLPAIVEWLARQTGGRGN